MATSNANPTAAAPPPMVFDDAPAPAPTQQQPPMVFDDQPQGNQQQPSMTFDAPPEPEGIFHRISRAMESTPDWAETVGFGKEAATALSGILNIVNQHAGGAIPKSAQPSMQKAAQWLKEQGDLRGWSEPEGTGEHLGAMGADYLGWEGLTHLIGGAGAGAAAIAEGSNVVKRARQLANLGDVLDKYPVLKQAAGIGLRTISEVMPALKTAATGYGQGYVMSGGDTGQATESALFSGLLHVGAGQALGPLGEYINGLKREAAEAGAALPPPLFRPTEPPPELAERTPEPQPQQPAPPEPRAPAAERLAAIEQPAAQEVTQRSLEDLNRFRTVDERGTPTNIQQLSLPSQSATQPYQFVVPGWSATSEAGDLLHEAGAKYKQEGTRVVAGKGSGNMQPWEMQQAEPFDLPGYAETPGAVLQTQDPVTGEPTPPPSPPEPMAPAEAATPPETPTISHREPIMRATQYANAVRPGSEIRQATTIGGPSILTTDPEVAAGHLDQINRIVEGPNFNALPAARQADILASRNEVMRQMQEYKNLQPQHEYSPYLHQPTFEPTNIDEALSRVGNMGDAAEEMMRGPKEMYQRWTNLTQGRPGGSFQDLNEEINDLQGKSGAANRQRLAQAQQEMQTMFNGSDPQLGRAGTNLDRSIARAQFNDGYLVKRIDDAFTNAYSGAARTGELSVNKLQGNWKALVNDVGEPRMQNVLGPERYEAMNNTINDMAGEPAGDKAAAAAADAEHRAALADWKTREATATAAEKAQHQADMDAWKQRDQLRQQINQANINEWQQNDAIKRSAKQKWYYDVARNGWHHLATGAGMEGVANIMPRGGLAMLTHKLGALLILKQIVTHPVIAKLAYQGAQLGTKPSIYGPIISDMVRRYSTRPQPTEDDDTLPPPE